MQKWTLAGLSPCGFEVESQFGSSTLLAPFCDGEGSKRGAGLRFLFFLPNGLLSALCFQQLPSGACKTVGAAP